MRIPLPDLLRSYGEILRQDDGSSLRVFATLAGLVTLVVAWFFFGALVQGISNLWKRHR